MAATIGIISQKDTRMNVEHAANQIDRSAMLREVLAKERADILTRLNDFRRDRDEDHVGVSGDEMDVARSLAEVETHARLLERAEGRLRDIEAALDRLEGGDYGICGNCGEEIPLARLKAIPFADFCVDCQTAITRDAHLGRGGSGASFRRWTAASETAAPAENAEELGLPPEEEHVESSFGPEEGEINVEAAPRRKRGRPRKNPL
jgi:DnaK suppressor protein